MSKEKAKKYESVTEYICESNEEDIDMQEDEEIVDSLKYNFVDVNNCISEEIEIKKNNEKPKPTTIFYKMPKFEYGSTTIIKTPTDAKSNSKAPSVGAQILRLATPSINNLASNTAITGALERIEKKIDSLEEFATETNRRFHILHILMNKIVEQNEKILAINLGRKLNIERNTIHNTNEIKKEIVSQKPKVPEKELIQDVTTSTNQCVDQEAPTKSEVATIKYKAAPMKYKAAPIESKAATIKSKAATVKSKAATIPIITPLIHSDSDDSIETNKSQNSDLIENSQTNDRHRRKTRSKRGSDMFSLCNKICKYNNPCEDPEELVQLNSELADENMQKKYISYLRRVSRTGDNMETFFRKILSDACFYQYNYAGVKDKLPLKVLTNWINCLKIAWGMNEENLRIRITTCNRRNKMRWNMRNYHQRKRNRF